MNTQETDVATDGTRCANSLSGEHEAIAITVTAIDALDRRALAYTVRCALCGVSRMDDVRFESRALPEEPTKIETTIQNVTPRQLFVTVNGGTRYQMDPHRPHNVRSARVRV